MKWLIRGTIPIGVITFVALVRLYQSWTSPEEVRRLFVERLRGKLNAGEVTLEAAKLRIWGGIAFENLTVSRNGKPVLIAPNGFISHDREQLAGGRLVIQELELEGPTLRLRRRADGVWDVADLFREQAGDGPMPSVVIRHGQIALIDEAIGPDPVCVFRDVSFTLIADTPTRWIFEADGDSDLLGPVSASGRWQAEPGELRAAVDLTRLPVGPKLTGLIERYVPGADGELGTITGRAKVHLNLTHRLGSPEPPLIEAEVELHDGYVDHPYLPLPLENVEVRLAWGPDGLAVEDASAKAGDSTVTLSLDMAAEPERRSPTPGDPFVSLERELPSNLDDHLRKLKLSVSHLTLEEAHFQKLPEDLRFLQRMFRPSGMISVGYEFERGAGGWTKRIAVRPEDMRVVYEEFPLPLSEMRGEVGLTLRPDRPKQLAMDLTANADGAPIRVRGSITGDAPTAGVRIQITGTGLPLTDPVIDALPDPYPKFIRELHATAKGDFVADIWQQEGTPFLKKRFEVTVREGRLRYDYLPYPMEQISGLLISIPPPSDVSRMGGPGGATTGDGSLILKDFRASHNGAAFVLSGRKSPMTDGGTVLHLAVNAQSLPLDAEARAAFEAVGLADAWDTFSPTGRINAAATVKMTDRPDGSGEDGLELTVTAAGASVRPRFFPYRLDALSGRVHYSGNKLTLTDFRASHGAGEWWVSSGEVIPRADGGIWADLRGVGATPLAADAELIRALPAGLRRVAEQLQLQGNFGVSVRRMVVDDPASDGLGADPEPVIYWDANLDLLGAKVTAGLDWEHVHGRLGCRGRYNSGTLGGVVGNLQFAQAWTLGLPVTDGLIRLHVDPREPEVLQLPTIQGQLFGGEIGGEARIRVEGPAYFDFKLNAMELELSEITRHYQLGPDAALEGSATAQLFLTNWPEQRGGESVLRGGGNLDVPEGRLLNLPFLLDLLKVLNLRPPDRTAFEEAHAIFHVHGDRIEVERLDLLGNAISLGGEGHLNLDGSDVRLEFYTIWSRLLQDWLASPVGRLTSALSKELFRIEVTGTIPDDLDYRKVAVPVVTDPLRRIADRISRNRMSPFAPRTGESPQPRPQTEPR